MANRLQLRRGTGVPGSVFYEGEPIFDKTGKTLYVGDVGGTGSGTGIAIASSDTYLASLEMLYKASNSDSGAIRLYEDTDNGNNYVAIAASAALGSSYTLRLPNGTGNDGQVLKTDGNGNLSWVSQAGGFSSFSVTDGSVTTSITDGNTLTFESGQAITINVSTGDTITIAAQTATSATPGVAAFKFSDFYINEGVVGVYTATDSTKGIASFRTEDFIVIDGVVGIVTGPAVDIGALLTAGIQTNITVSYFEEGPGLNFFIATATDSVLGLASFDNTDFTVVNGQVSLADTTTGAVQTISGTSNEIEVSRTNSTVTIGLPNNVSIANDLTVGGNLIVVGSAVTFQTEIVKVEDRLLELGLVGGGTTTSSTWDLGVAFNYGDGTAKKSGVFWIDNTIIGIASAISISNDTGNTSADPGVTIDTYAPVAAGGLYIGGTTSNELVINSAREAVNLVFDGGGY